MRRANPRDFSQMHFDIALGMEYDKSFLGRIIKWILKRLNPDWWWANHGMFWRLMPYNLRMFEWPKSIELQLEEAKASQGLAEMNAHYYQRKLKEHQNAHGIT